jgi:hypothetical protein
MEINSFHNGVLGLLIQIQRAIKRRIRVTAPVWQGDRAGLGRLAEIPHLLNQVRGNASVDDPAPARSRNGANVN